MKPITFKGFKKKAEVIWAAANMPLPESGETVTMRLAEGISIEVKATDKTITVTRQ